MKIPFFVVAGSLGLGGSSTCLAQQIPDAGQVLQQQQLHELPKPSSGTAIDVRPPSSATTAPGGALATVNTITIRGNTVFSQSELVAVLGDFAGKAFDLAGLRELAGKITAFYQRSGYPFARAYLPPQVGAGGDLHIDVLEGRYGKVTAQGDVRAQDFLDDLTPGSVIDSKRLERAALILDDLPGIRTTPIIRPGQDIGTGDLDVPIHHSAALTGDVGLDNYGNRYTGGHRLRANLQWNSPFMLGDQFNVRALYTEEQMWLGSLGYALPVGTSGLRLNAGYAHTYYQLAKDFKALNATGTAKVSTLGLSYPIVRSQRSNLSLSATYQHKVLHDEQETTDVDERKSSTSLPIALSFDHRDGLGGGGITYGALTYTRGHLSLDAGLSVTDRASGQYTAGHFAKTNLDIARLQALPGGFSLFGRFSGQWASKNLDSSESFSQGGAYGVRAFPSSEGNGDEGWLTQLELRYALGAIAPYIFYDAGHARLNAKPEKLVSTLTVNDRFISGSGLGIRYLHEQWSVDANVAWRNAGGRALSDSADRNPRAWVTIVYNFN